MRLVADIGGTKTRIALSEAGRVLPDTVQVFQNDNFDGIAEVLRQYLSGQLPGAISQAIVAVAGPVSENSVQMTNRDWSISAASLSEMLGGAPARLVNDMTALGHAVPALVASRATNGGRQSLVVNIGTGFNVCPVIETANGVICPESQMGHVRLSQPLKAALDDRFGERVADFTLIEDCFSGRGHARLSSLWAEQASRFSRRYSERSQAIEFSDFYAGLIRQLMPDLIAAFMPLSGIWFCGGVARAVLSSQVGRSFCDELTPRHRCHRTW